MVVLVLLLCSWVSCVGWCCGWVCFVAKGIGEFGMWWVLGLCGWLCYELVVWM